MNPELDDTIIIAELVDETPNLPAVKDKPGQLAIPDDEAHVLGQVADLAAASWTRPWKGRWRWANGLPAAIREGDPESFKALIVDGLAHGFDGRTVTEDEFKVAYLEIRAKEAVA